MNPFNDFLSSLFGGTSAPQQQSQSALVPVWTARDETAMVEWVPPPKGSFQEKMQAATGPQISRESFPSDATDVPAAVRNGTAPAAPANVETDTAGRINPVSFQKTMEAKVAASHLNGYVPKDGEQFGIKTGAPREWARLFSMVIQQESGHRLAQRNPDGSLRRFATTIPTEKSFGPGQFNIGEYGLKTWDDVNNPSRVGDALIAVAQKHVFERAGVIRGPNNTGLAAYFGSIRRPNETLQHSKWWESTVMPSLK
jgi:hypothetical protein